MACEHEVQRGSQAVDVRPNVHRVAVRHLFRGHVVRGAEHDFVVVLHRELVGVVLVESGQAQVENARDAFAIDEHVARFDVPVDNAAAEGVVQADGGLVGVTHRAVDVQRAELLHDPEEVRAVHVVHHDEVEVAVLIDVVSADDVRVLEAPGGSGFAVEATERRGLFRLGGRQHFHRNPSLHERVFAEEHLAHATDADAFEQLELTDCEPAPLPKQKLFGLEVGQHAVANHVVRELAGVGGQPAGELPALKVGAELELVDHSALANELDQLFDRGGHGHRAPVAGGVCVELLGPFWAEQEFLPKSRTGSDATQIAGAGFHANASENCCFASKCPRLESLPQQKPQTRLQLRMVEGEAGGEEFVRNATHGG